MRLDGQRALDEKWNKMKEDILSFLTSKDIRFDLIKLKLLFELS